ncbi:MAG: glycerophosphodiester phosphodiesterase [Hymenobacter sp.]|nr:MAG: glycerophosphodiester phosphodiesterase [Hymenobacter sp.]
MFTSPLPLSPTSTPEVHGHRGCRGLFPENTLPAFQHALALGVDALELDVVISQDNQVVVSHEPWLAAHLGRDPHGHLINPVEEHHHNLYQLPYATIRQGRVGEWPLPGFPEQQPVPSYRPLLCEVLQQAETLCQQLGRPAVRYSVELKSSPAGDGIFHPVPSVFVALVLAELRAAAVEPRTTLLSFDPRVLRATRRAAPSLPLCLLLENDLPPVAELFAGLGFEPTTLGPDFQLLSAATIWAIRATYPHLRLVPWTVNSVADLQMVRDWRVEGITTDYPDRLLALLGRL